MIAEAAETLISRFSGIRLVGMVTALPEALESAEDLGRVLGAEAMHKVAAGTGIERRHVAPPGTTALTLGQAAAAEVLAALGWDAADLDLLVVVTQTPEQPLPGNGPLLHHRLGLGRRCAVLDLNSGCSGFVDGLWTAAALLNSGSARRALLVVGDTTTQYVSADDRATRPLFGDAVSAIALERDGDPATSFAIVAGADGSGAPYLHVGADDHRLVMDGTQVFTFTLREVPRNIAATLDAAGLTLADIDHAVFHQANAAMIRHLATKLGLPPERVVVGMRDYGNTSSASIPLALCTALAEVMVSAPQRLLLSGFGVGWRWGSIALRTVPLVVCGTVLLDDGNRVTTRTLAAKGG